LKRRARWGNGAEMRMLAIDCATEACSLALFEREGAASWRLVEHRHELLGRGHAEQLVPLIATLPDKGRAAEIRVSLGPGSFTGVRIGLAAARALGLAWGAEVLGFSTLALVAQMNDRTRAILPGSPGIAEPADILVCMNGGHGEWFVQSYSPALRPAGALLALPPTEAVARCDQPIVAGSQAREFVAMRGWGEARQMLPDTRSAGSLDAHHLTRSLAPIYGRAPDARLPG
jgi:tRNA threonylcarbamoyladenosine biosynthesis protein TsaB